MSQRIYLKTEKLHIVADGFIAGLKDGSEYKTIQVYLALLISFLAISNCCQKCKLQFSYEIVRVQKTDFGASYNISADFENF